VIDKTEEGWIAEWIKTKRYATARMNPVREKEYVVSA